MEWSTGTALLRRLRDAGGLPAHADLPAGKGRAEWTRGDLLHRVSLKQLPEGVARWSLSIGDRQLGRSFDEGGVLALVTIRPAPDVDEELRWPSMELAVPAFLRELHGSLVAAAQFAGDRRQLCELLLSPASVRRGSLVADLRSGHAERVLRALCVARAGDDAEVVAAALAILHAPAVDGPADGPSLVGQARIWADQWSRQSGLRIEVPDANGTLSDAGEPRSGLAELPTFWERVG